MAFNRLRLKELEIDLSLAGCHHPQGKIYGIKVQIVRNHWETQWTKWMKWDDVHTMVTMLLDAKKGSFGVNPASEIARILDFHLIKPMIPSQANKNEGLLFP